MISQMKTSKGKFGEEKETKWQQQNVEIKRK